jgi:hypothetical protein
MKLTFLHSKIVVLFCASMIMAASLIAANAVAGRRSVQERQPKTQQVTDLLPAILQKVRDVQISKARIADQGTPRARAIFELTNRSGKAVTSFTLTFGGVSVGRDGGIDTDVPATVIEPYGTTTIEIPVSNLDRANPVILAAVLYGDGTEDGQDIVLELVHNQRAEAKAKRDARRKSSQP